MTKTIKTILITGSSTGFGYEMVSDFLQVGYKVIATLRNLESRKYIYEDLLIKYPKTLIVKELDVTKASDRESMKNYIIANFNSSLDVLVNNAGFGSFGALEDTTESQIRQQMEVNFFAPTLMIKEFLPFLRKAQGRVINISSIMGRYSSPLAAVYSASKYAIEGLTEGLKYELAPHGVQITTIQPGGHRTSFIKSMKWGEKSHDPNSPYIKQTNGFQKMLNKMLDRKKAPQATNISALALTLIKKKKMPRRVVVGNDAKFISILQKVLPERLYHFLLIKGHKAIFGK